MITHILLLPHPEHRERLLAPGAPVYDDVARAFGWAIPRGWTTGEDVDLDDAPPLSTTMDVDGDCHLVLARDGAVVDEGSDRLSRVARLDRHTVDIIVGARLRGRRNDGEGEITRFGILVLLDVDGREVAP